MMMHARHRHPCRTNTCRTNPVRIAGDACGVAEDPHAAGSSRRALLFNDILLLVDDEAEQTVFSPTATAAAAVAAGRSSGGTVTGVECISLAKVQVKKLPESAVGGHVRERTCCAFELWSIARIWRFVAPSEEQRGWWVDKLQAQVHSFPRSSRLLRAPRCEWARSE